MPGLPRTLRLRRITMAAVVAGASLLLSLGPARTIRPPGTFPKYPDAVTHWDPSRSQDYSPLYLGLARAVVPVAGVPGLRWAQTVLLATACTAAALTVELEAGALAGLLAGLLLASYRPLLVYAGVLEPEVLIVTLLALALLAVHRARRREVSPWARCLWAAAGSACLALAAMARPQYVLLLPLWILWSVRSPGEPGRWRAPAAALLAATVLLAPFGVHRLMRYGSLSVMNPGPVFYEGNGPQSLQGTYTPPRLVARVAGTLGAGADLAHVAYRRVAAAELGRPAGPAATNRYWMDLALEGLRQLPLQASRRFASKALLALAPYELHDLLNAHDLDRRLRRWLPWGFGLPLGLLLVVLLVAPRHLLPFVPALSIAGLSWLVQIVFYPSARQRLPMALALFVVTISLLASRTPNRRRLVSAAGAAVVLVAGLTLFSAPIACANDAMASTFLGLPHRSGGEVLATLFDGRAWRPAVRRTAEAVALAEDTFEDGRPVAIDSSLTVQLRRASGPGWLRARAAWLVARSLAVSGRDREALGQVRRAVALDGGFLPARALLTVLESPACPEGLDGKVRVPGEDPLDAQFLLAEAAAPVRGPDCAARVGQAVFAAFPKLAVRTLGTP